MPRHEGGNVASVYGEGGWEMRERERMVRRFEVDSNRERGGHNLFGSTNLFGIWLATSVETRDAMELVDEKSSWTKFEKVLLNRRSLMRLSPRVWSYDEVTWTLDHVWDVYIQRWSRSKPKILGFLTAILVCGVLCLVGWEDGRDKIIYVLLPCCRLLPVWETQLSVY